MADKQDLIWLMNEAERRGYMETAKEALVMLEGMVNQAEEQETDKRFQLDPVSLIPGMDQSITGQKEQPTIGERVAGAGEAALTMATGATGGVIGLIDGFTGQFMSELASGNIGTKEAADRIEDASMRMSSTFTFQPRSEEGKRQVQAVTEALLPLAPLAGLSGQVQAIGQAGRVARVPKGKILLQDGQPTPALRKALNKKGLVYEGLTEEAKSVIPRISGQPLKKTVKDALVEQIKSKATDDSLAGFKLVGGDVVPDEVQLNAIKQGFSKGLVRSVDVANKKTKKDMQSMLTIARKIKNNERLSGDIRPGAIAGREVAKRIQFIRDRADRARVDLNRIARTNLHKKPIDLFSVEKILDDSLADMNVTFTVKDGKTVPVFKGSVISKNRAAKKAVLDAIDLIDETEPNAFKAHILKRQLDDLIDFKKKSKEGLSETGRNVLKSLRHEVNRSIREISPEYAEVNDILHKSLTAIDDFKKATKLNVDDIFGIDANEKIGMQSRKILSKYKAGQDIRSSIEDLDVVAANLGGKFNSDVKQLVYFNNRLEDRFGDPAAGSFKSEITSAIKRAGRESPGRTALETGLDVASKGVEKMMRNDFKAFEAMQELLNR